MSRKGTGFVPRAGSLPRHFTPPPSTEEQIQQRRRELEDAHAQRMTWAAEYPVECREFYGVTPQRRRDLAERIARDLCGERWGWQLFETADGGVLFSILEYRPCGGHAQPEHDA